MVEKSTPDADVPEEPPFEGLLIAPCVHCELYARVHDVYRDGPLEAAYFELSCGHTIHEDDLKIETDEWASGEGGDAGDDAGDGEAREEVSTDG